MDLNKSAEDLYTTSRFCRHFEAETGRRQPALRRQVQSAGWAFARALRAEGAVSADFPARYPALARAATKGEPLDA